MSALTSEHRPSCIASQAWDIQEAYDHCSCEFPYPRKVCSECYNQPHQHKRNCSRRKPVVAPNHEPKKEA